MDGALYYFLKLFPMTEMYFLVVIFHIRATSPLESDIYIYNCKNRLVVLITEQVYPGFAHLFLVSQAYCIKQPERWQFPSCFLLFSLFTNKEERRKLVVVYHLDSSTTCTMHPG